MARTQTSDGCISPVKNRKGEVQKNTWRVCVSFGTGADGKRNKVQKIVHGTKSDARKVRDQIKEEYGNICFDTKEITFGSYAETWKASLQTAGKANAETIKGYMRKLSLMTKRIGDMRLIDIKPDDIESALAAMRAEGIGGSTLNQVFAYTKRVFEMALDRDIILRNPCNKVQAPKAGEPNRKSLTASECTKLHQRLDEEELRILASFESKEERVENRTEEKGRSCVRGLSEFSSIMAIRIALATGMRRGEVCGLLWECVDIPNRKITVKRSLTPQMNLKTPKTKSGIRTISIGRDIAAKLQQWHSLQMEMIESIYGAESEKCKAWGMIPVCCSDKGDLYDPTNLQRWWQSFRAEIGFPDLQMHELRHTQATQLLGNHVDVKTVASRLGHKKPSTTLNIYSHAIPENDEAAADLIDSILTAEKGPAVPADLKSA